MLAPEPEKLQRWPIYPIRSSSKSDALTLTCNMPGNEVKVAPGPGVSALRRKQINEHLHRQQRHLITPQRLFKVRILCVVVFGITSSDLAGHLVSLDCHSSSIVHCSSKPESHECCKNSPPGGGKSIRPPWWLVDPSQPWESY